MKPALVLPLLLLLGLPLGAQTPAEPESGQPGAQSEPAYEGPSLPSRRGGGNIGREGDWLKLRPFASVQGIYDSGLTAVSVDGNGKPAGASGYGVEASVGAIGFRSWKHTVIGVDFRGNGRHYGNHSYYDGLDTSLTMSLEHQAGRRWRFQLGESVGSYSRNYYVPPGASWMGVSDFAPTSVSNLAGHEMFDSRTNSLSTTARAIYLPTARLSFSFGGSGVVVRRRSAALVGMNGYTTSGDVAYRVGRRQTLGFDYNFTHFDYENAFGSTDAHGVAVNFAVGLAKGWEFRLRAGGNRIESLRLQQVTVDPAIAALIGRNFGIETYHRVLYAPAGEASLVRTMKRTSVALSYSRDLNPGNGLMLTSMNESASVHTSWTASRRVSFGFTSGVSKYKSVGQNLGRYLDYGGGGGMTYLLGKGLSVVVRAEARQYSIAQTDFSRTSYRTSLGIAWSPGDVPLSLW